MSNKQIITKENNQIFIIKSTSDSYVPLFCPCCSYTMKTMEDSISYRKSGVCHYCDDRWGNRKGIDLINQVFPDKGSEEWSEYIETREIYSKPLFIFK